MRGVSENYRTLSPSEINSVAEGCAAAWQSGLIPERQYELAAKMELAAMRSGVYCAPFAAFIATMLKIPADALSMFLDIGASAGYYSEVLRSAGFNVDYRAADYSQPFKDLAERLYPGIAYDIADARELPYADNSFAIVLSGACIMHLQDYESAIKESARVASRYVIFHRTPVFTEKPTAAFLKEGYGVQMVEWHFSEAELLLLCLKHGLREVHAEDVFFDYAKGFGHRTYLFEKQK